MAAIVYSVFYNDFLRLFLLCISVQVNYAKMRVPNDQILLNLELKIDRVLSAFTLFHILKELETEPFV